MNLFLCFLLFYSSRQKNQIHSFTSRENLQCANLLTVLSDFSYKDKLFQSVLQFTRYLIFITCIHFHQEYCLLLFSKFCMTNLYTWYLYISYNTLLLLVVVSCCSCYCASLQKGPSINNVTRQFPTGPFPPQLLYFQICKCPHQILYEKRAPTPFSPPRYDVIYGWSPNIN